MPKIDKIKYTAQQVQNKWVGRWDKMYIITIIKKK